MTLTEQIGTVPELDANGPLLSLFTLLLAFKLEFLKRGWGLGLLLSGRALAL